MKKNVPIEFPKETQEGTQSFLSKWLKKVGDIVSIHEPIAEVSTDKVIMEIASPAAGVIVELTAHENQEIAPGDILGTIAVGEVASAAEGKPAPVMSPGRASVSPATSAAMDLSPAVKKLIKEHGVDAASITGTGKGGRITPEDVERHVQARVAHRSSGDIPSRLIPHSPMRKTIARHLSDSLLRIAPHVTTVFECDVSAILAHKKAHEAKGTKVTLTAYFLEAMAVAAKAVPEANSRWYDDHLEVFEEVNIGVGTATADGGILVPVIRNVGALSLDAIAAHVHEVVIRGRDNNLAKEDLADGTITISNHGMSGSLFATPIIIHQPQSAILGVGKVEKRPKVITVDGKDSVEVRPCVFVTLTIDHRVMDGFKANAFMRAFVEHLEDYQ